MNNANQKNMVMGILAYLGPFVIVSYLTLKEDLFVKFHIKQGLVLLIIEVTMWFLGMVFWPLWIFLNLINFVVLVLAIIGIINVTQGKEKKLLLVGDYARYFN